MQQQAWQWFQGFTIMGPDRWLLIDKLLRRYPGTWTVQSLLAEDTYIVEMLLEVVRIEDAVNALKVPHG